MVPVHNGTFDLAFHSWYEPLERVNLAAQQSKTVLLTPTFGQPISLVSLTQHVETEYQVVAQAYAGANGLLYLMS